MPNPGQTSTPDVTTPVVDNSSHPHMKKAGLAVTLAALGVVFGDIGTSPLYSLQTVFTLDGGIVKAIPAEVYGVISLMFWSITLVVSAKYVGVVMRADNDGEGGVMALAALARRLYASRGGRTALLMAMGILGVSLFYGDSVITPAISILSSVEGLTVPYPGLSHLVLPIALVILVILFAAQRFGTGKVGTFFGPVMLLWFVAIAAFGLASIARYPAVFKALSPTYGAQFIFAHPFTSFVAMGAVVLCITGAEALYADMGHFGRAPIAKAWFFVVFPCLTLNYLGQASLIVRHPEAVKNPFFLLIPSWGQVPMVVLATFATVIASQAVISGAFSLTRQAMRLGLIPAVRVRQTSESEGGQIYLPGINSALFVGVLVLMLTFQSSARLATAYGVSVTGALVIDTILLLITARVLWKWGLAKMLLAGVLFGGVEATFLAANLSKVLHGGWLPLLIALSVFTLMTTWQRGRELVTYTRSLEEGDLTEFLDAAHTQTCYRKPGTAVFPHPTKATAPLALKANMEHNGVLHEHVVIVSVLAENVPHVTLDRRLEVDDLGDPTDGIWHLTIRYGFSDTPDIPDALRMASGEGELDVDPDTASYFLSRATLSATSAKGMRRWRKRLFSRLARNAANPAEVFNLPQERTVVMGTVLDI